ncbi:MAG: cob(I)yrinic acid a,c-diamide adenosyltransferase [Bryobacter sp.]|jgi:cob(I)alamin adenosyltransferase|nr:cob(I)yrinic acid a,c-diamide adenosyltransferase [Bryobacter sp. CoA8 C33]
MSEAFHEPRLALNRIYTKTGDKGETGLVGGQRVPKDAQRIAVFGTVDELNSFVGLVRISASDNKLNELEAICERIQHELFNLGSVLATLPEDLHPNQPRVNQETITQLERDIDQYNSALPPLRSFVLPGGSRLCAELHVCRTICRRAERELVTLSHQEEVPRDALLYLNRLSDAFFVWSRWVNQALGLPEALWQPNKGAR